MSIYTIVGMYGGCIKQYNSKTDVWYTRVENNSTDNISLYQIHGSSDGQYLMACGMNSSAERAIVKSSDGGLTWSNAISGLPGSAATQPITGIHVISSTEAYCYCPSSVPGSDGIYIWNGSTWTFYFGAYGTSRILKSDDGYIYLLRGSTFSRWNGTLYNDASLPGDTFYVDFCIDTNGVIYLFEADRGFWTNSKVYRGSFNSLSLDRSPTDYHVPSLNGSPVAWVGSDNAIYYVARKFLGGYGNYNQYVSKRDPNTGAWSDIYLFHSTDWHETAVRAIAGSSDSDIFVLAGLTYWWNDGKGYNYKYNGISWNLEQDEDYVRVGPQMQLAGLFTASLPFVITGVSPTTVTTAGGDAIVLTGTWDIGKAVSVFFGPLGTIEDPPCTFGQGHGYSILSPAGPTMTCYVPHALEGTANKLTVRIDADVITLDTVMSAVLRPRYHKIDFIRRSFPPSWNVGSRRPEEEQ